MSDIKIEPIIFDSYFAVIKNSRGSRAFRNFYGLVNGKKKDLVKNGKLSCAFFASGIFYYFKLIKEPHLTVRGLVKDMMESGWHEIEKPKKGCVLIWEAIKSRNGTHKHIGFYVNEKQAISNNSEKGTVDLHHLTYGIDGGKPVRKIEKILWHKKLGGAPPKAAGG